MSDFAREMDKLYQWYMFLAERLCALSPGICDINVAMEGADQAVANNDLRAMRLGYKTMVDWANHLDEPHKSQVAKSFQQRFSRLLSYP